MAVRSIVSDRRRGERFSNFWSVHFFPIVLPLLLGLGLGPLVAALIASENWIFAASLVFLVPLAILLIRYPFAAIIVWMVVMPWFPFRDAYKYVYFAVHRLLIPLGLGITILSHMLDVEKCRPLRPKLADLAVIAFGAMGVVSIFVAGSHWKTVFILQDRFLVPFSAYWLIRISNAQRQALRRLLPFMLLVCLAESVVGLVGWFAPQALPSIWHMRLTGDRVSGTFGASGTYGCVLMFFLVFLYHEAMHREPGLVRMALLLVFGLGAVCVFFTFTRSIWLAGIFVLLGLLCLYPKATALLLVVILPIMLIMSVDLLAREFAYASKRLSTEDTANARVVLAAAGRQMFLARPVFGWGYNTYDRHDWKFMKRAGNVAVTEWHVREGTSHNTLLTILAEMGVVGFFLLYFPVFWWLVRTVRALPRVRREGFWSRRILIVMWLPLIAQIIVSQATDLRFATYALTLFWIGLGFVANIVESYLY